MLTCHVLGGYVCLLVGFAEASWFFEGVLGLFEGLHVASMFSSI